MNPSQNILTSWQANAQNWIATIANEEIESRKLATNKAIIDTICGYAVKKILDVGCGEGWLTRSLVQLQMDAYGVDGVKELVMAAIEKGGGTFFQYNYQQIAAGDTTLPVPFDAAVINFALIDKEDTERLLCALPSLLRSGGMLFIQTLHPLGIASTSDYISGWKEGSWTGLKRSFVLPYQWYFRTFGDWLHLFSEAGFKLEAMKEPLHPETKKPLSVIFVLRTDKL